MLISHHRALTQLRENDTIPWHWIIDGGQIKSTIPTPGSGVEMVHFLSTGLCPGGIGCTSTRSDLRHQWC
jgi:hypothetical protein